jgi:hypothetical protein
MGADFLYATVPCFTLTPERERRFTEMFNQYIAELDGTTASFRDRFELESDLDPELANAALLDAAVTAMRQSDFDRQHGSREISYLSLSGMDYDVMITGGMSWGDSPTDAFDSFCLLEELPSSMYQQLIAWAREDKNNPPDIAETSDAMDAESREPVLRGGQTLREEDE